jgi:hypothetical protein
MQILHFAGRVIPGWVHSIDLVVPVRAWPRIMVIGADRSLLTESVKVERASSGQSTRPTE